MRDLYNRRDVPHFEDQILVASQSSDNEEETTKTELFEDPTSNLYHELTRLYLPPERNRIIPSESTRKQMLCTRA